MKAVIAVNANGTEYVEHRTTTKHFCSLRKYDPAKYTVDVTTRIVENHNFKVIKYTQKGITSSKLFIFDPSKKNLCRGYIWDKDNEYYLCIGCNSESQRIFARICKNVDGNEYLMLSKNEHVCDLREFNSDKYKDDIIVKKPMFQHVEQKVAGEKRKYLLIFTANDQKFYYKFSYENGYLPICSKCTQKNLYIQAYVLTDDDGNEYVSVRNKEHICKPLEYNSSDFEDNQIIKPPGYQVIKRNWRGKFVEKLVVFDSTDKSLCYEYTLQQTKKTKRYKCNECHHKHSTCVIAWIINQRKENEHVELSKIQHKCKLIKFEDPNSTIIHSPNFKIIKCVRKAPSGIPKDHLFVYSSLESKLCYRYYSDSGRNHFICHECAYKKKIMVSARLHKNENGEDFVQLGGNKHVCEPQPEKSVLKKMSRFLEILN
uniref:Uncharacterized protein n=1 Tax=Panagrolaimus sp. ES5 TaxID=591445 RepID=A0AC34GU60_9BILA